MNELKELAELLIQMRAAHDPWPEFWKLFTDCPGDVAIYMRISKLLSEGNNLLQDLRIFLQTKKVAA